MANSSVRRFLGASPLRYLLFPALLVTGAFMLAGCGKTTPPVVAAPPAVDPKDPKFVVAEKGTWQISRAELDTEVNSFLKGHNATAEQVGPAKMPMVETMMLKNMVLKKLILDKAATLQLKDVDKEEATQLDAVKQSVPPGQDFDAQLKTAGMTLDDLKAKIHEQVVIHKVLEADAFKDVDPTDAQIDAIYLKYKDQFNTPERIRASRVVVLVDATASAADKAKKKKIIDAAHARVAKGEDFSKVATEVSEDKSTAPKGGDMDFFQKGEAEQGFDDVAFKLKEGVLSPVFTTALGYEFVKVTTIQPAGTIPVAQAREVISGKLKEQNEQIQSQAYAKKLLADSGVTYHLTLVDPPSQMPGAGGPPDDAGGPPPQGAPDASQQPPPEVQQQAIQAAQQAADAAAQQQAAPSAAPAPAPTPAPAPSK